MSFSFIVSFVFPSSFSTSFKFQSFYRNCQKTQQMPTFHPPSPSIFTCPLLFEKFCGPLHLQMYVCSSAWSVVLIYLKLSICSALFFYSFWKSHCTVTLALSSMFLNNIFIETLDFVSYIIYWPPLIQDKGFYFIFLLLPNPSFLLIFYFYIYFILLLYLNLG